LADRESGAPGRPRYVVHRAHDAGMAYLRRVHSVKSLAARRGCRKGSQNVTRRTFPRQVTGPFVQHLFNYGFSGRASALIPPPAVYESVPRLLSTLSTRLVADNPVTRRHTDMSQSTMGSIRRPDDNVVEVPPERCPAGHPLLPHGTPGRLGAMRLHASVAGHCTYTYRYPRDSSAQDPRCPASSRQRTAQRNWFERTCGCDLKGRLSRSPVRRCWIQQPTQR
jgi:hypothetical protein